MRPPAAPSLLGRAHELDRVDALLDAVERGLGPRLMFSGEPGSGKTSLLAAARERATAFTVVECRGVEWEAELPFSGLHELVSPLLDHLPALPEPQVEALQEALGLAPARAAKPLHLLAGAASLLAEATRERPVLLIADDLQWIDSPTLQVLSFVARRLRGEQLGMLVASRPGHVLPGWSERPVELDPLGHEAVAELALRELGRPLPDGAVRDLARAAGGNPLAIVESLALFGDALPLRGTPLDQPLPVGGLIDRGFADRLDALSTAARSALDVAAATLSDDAAPLRDALGRLGIPAEGLVEAEHAGVLTMDGAHVRFSHPLLRALVHRRTSPDDLRRSHGALAAVALDAGARAWHAAASVVAPDDAIAADLDASADRFERRGGHLAAAQALARAAELTVDPDDRAERYLRAGLAANLAGRARWTQTLYDAALGAAVSPGLRLRCELMRTYVAGHLDPPVDLFTRHMELAAQAAGLDDEVEAMSLAGALQESLFVGRRAAVDDAIAGLEAILTRGTLDPPDAREVATSISVVLTSVGEPGSGGDFGRAQLLDSAEILLGDDRNHDVQLAETLQWVEEYDLASRVCEHTIDRARPRGDAFNLAGGLWARGGLRYRTGDWDGALQDLHEATSVYAATEHMAQEPVLQGALAIVRASRGEAIDPAELDAIDARSAALGFQVFHVLTATAQGLADLGAGRATEAVGRFERAREVQHVARHVQPSLGTWPADLVEAYAAAGQPVQARAQLDDLRAWAERVGRRWALAAVARLEGVLVEDDAFEAHFVEALRQYGKAQDPFGQARAQLAFGQRLRRSRRRVEAREQLTAALEAFERLGARPWAEQARRELGASAPSVRRGPAYDSEALTPQEVQVARLVVGGASNKEVAASMFLSPKTIETHLSRIYRKLDVASRTQLAAKLREPTD